MFPTFISILDIQSWWEVPSVAHFCSLFRTAFNLLDFDIEDLEEALLTDGTEESSWLQELIVRLLSGCLPNNEISTFNYQMFLRRLFRQKCQEHDQYNPFNTDIDFQLLPLRTKVDILHALCDFRLDADDVLDRLKNLEADSLRVEPLGFDDNQSAYWYFYGTRLYREDFKNKNSKKEKSIWQVICFTEEDWFQLAKKFKKSISKAEKQLFNTLTENFLPELPRLFREKERLARKRLLENQPRRTSSRIRKQELVAEKEEAVRQQLKAEKESERLQKEQEEEKEKQLKQSIEKRRREAYERRARLKQHSDTQSDNSENRYDMAGAKTRIKKSKTRQRQNSESSASSKDRNSVFSNASNRSSNRSNARTENKGAANTTTVGRQTNNSLACATGQIVIQPVSNPHRKKLKTSQVFRQTDEDLQTGMHKILDHVKNHNDAWPFVDPVDEEYAPNYYSVIRKPMDLQSMEERLERGSYKTFTKFKDDFQLIVDNCRLYNGADNEYTKMVDNLQKVFERTTERYLDEITSTDEEIAVEYPDPNKDAKLNNKRKKSDSGSVTKRKPTLAAETDNKRDRSRSVDSVGKENNMDEVEEKIPIPPNTTVKKHSKKESQTQKASKKHQKTKLKSEVKSKSESSGKKKNQKNAKTKKIIKAKSPSPVRSRSKSFNRSPSRERWSSSPPPSWPPSSPDSRFDFSPHRNKKKGNTNLSDGEKSNSEFSKHDKWKEVYKDDFTTTKPLKDRPQSPPKHKDKHNKLRETIEKLKAKSDFANKLKEKESSKDEGEKMKENKDDNKSKNHVKTKHKTGKAKNIVKPVKNAEVDDAGSIADSALSDSKKQDKNCSNNNLTGAKAASMEALTLATEQTLKDINKWLDDTPKFSEFSSASNSPSHFATLDDFDLKMEQDLRKKNEKVFPKKEPHPKEKKKPFSRDPSKFFRRREIQRTIDRLQPGKSKGNLISNMQNANKPDELFPLGPLAKAKDTKNSLIVKTDDTAPKLSLGSVLDSFGAHKFVDDPKKEDDIKEEIKEEASKVDILDGKTKAEEAKPEDPDSKAEKESVKSGSSSGKPTPNLSAWFKAFGAPKVQPTQKKNDVKTDAKEEKIDEKKDDGKKIVPPGDPSPTSDNPLIQHGQPISRQRKISTGSSMSERSSFSQDMDSPRVGIDERLSYPAPYPSPLHKSPSGASPIMASPRPDVSPKSATYPTFNGQMRVGFYQDTVSTKSSPDKSCSPRDNSQSPYAQYSEQVYTPPAQNPTYSYGNPPAYSQSPCYSTQANMDANNVYSYSKSQYPMKLVPNYANSPVSNTQMHSPQPNSPIPQQQMSPNLESRIAEKQMFPVKKRAYNDNEPASSPNRYDIQQHQHQQKNQQEQFAGHRHAEMNLMIGRHDIEPNQNSQHSSSPASIESPKQYVHQNVPEQRQAPQVPQSIEREVNQEEINQNSPRNNSYLAPTNYNFNSDVGYPLNIPSTRSLDTDRTIDMTKYTNMGYASGDLGFQRTTPFTRSDLNFARSTPTTVAPIQSLSQTSAGNNQTLPSPNLVMRYSDPNMMNMSYKPINTGNNMPSPQLSTLNRTNILQTVRSTSETMVNRLSQPLDVSSSYKSPDVTIPRPNYNTPSLDMDQSLNLRGNIGNISHIVDRFPTDDRMLGLQSTPQAFYPEKTHMLSKPIATSSSGLPMFTQPNITIPYRENIQVNSSLYGRQMSEMQNANVMPQEKPVSLPQVPEKKTKKRKANKTAAAPPTVQTETASNTANNTPNQGFQSYAGLKNSTTSIEPSAISLKTTSVVPGSAFNFGPGPAGLGLGSGLYADKDAYPNFLEDFRSAPNYYMAAAAATHHRSTPDTAEKPVRTAHQSTTSQAPPTYPFLGAPQPRPPSYPLGGTFMPPPPHQASLMDPSSPLYQQYLQAGVLHQGLLGPGAYPAGYHHPALSMRQPYDSMTRPSWL